MDSEGELWGEHHQKLLGEADWRGTARLYDTKPEPDASLERVAGLDPERMDGHRVRTGRCRNTRVQP